MIIKNKNIQIYFEGEIISKDLNNYIYETNNYEHIIVIKIEKETYDYIQKYINELCIGFDFEAVGKTILTDLFFGNTEEDSILSEDSILFYSKTNKMYE